MTIKLKKLCRHARKQVALLRTRFVEFDEDLERKDILFGKMHISEITSDLDNLRYIVGQEIKPTKQGEDLRDLSEKLINREISDNG